LRAAECALVIAQGNNSKREGLDMTSNLKVILSAVGVAALVTSPALAKPPVRTNQAAPAAVTAYGLGAVTPNAARPLVTPYAPNVREPAHETVGPSPDFQLGSEK
jgi:hypothetical protein